jgi:6-pyruvoyltetrahydropterin/6-carboxytetrahydropterin synthase
MRARPRLSAAPRAQLSSPAPHWNEAGMARVKVTRRVHFCAAHRLGRDDWPEARNLEVFGGCANPNWHGHNYELDVTVEGEIDPETGFVHDLKALREVVERCVVDDVDHRNLNLDVEWMRGVNPTTENLVVAMWQQLQGTLPAGVELARLVLWETPRNYVEYTGG